MPLVDYRFGFDYGTGVNSLTGENRGLAIKHGSPTKVSGAEGQDWDLRLNQVESTEDLHHALGLSAELDVSWGLFGGSGKFAFAESTQVNSYSLFLLVSVAARNAFEQVLDIQFTENAASLMQQGQAEAFRRRYGDTFVRGMLTGGEFYAVLEIKTRSTEEKQEMSAEMSASYGTFVDAEGEFEEELTSKLQDKQMSIYAFAKGGDDTVPRTLEEVVQKAINFPTTVAGDRSVPYAALLVDYETVDIIGAPTWIDTLNARETLSSLASTRQFVLQKISDIDYVLQNQGQFASLDDDALTQLNSTREQLRQQLVQTTKAASRCAGDVMDCEPATLEMPDLGFLDGFELPIHAGKPVDSLEPAGSSESVSEKAQRLSGLRRQASSLNAKIRRFSSAADRLEEALRKNPNAILTSRDHRGAGPPKVTRIKISESYPDRIRSLRRKVRELEQERSRVLVQIKQLEGERAGSSPDAVRGLSLHTLRLAAAEIPVVHALAKTADGTVR